MNNKYDRDTATRTNTTPTTGTNNVTGATTSRTSGTAAEATTSKASGTVTQNRTAQTNAERTVAQQKVAVPVIEEELKVGKREVNRGGVRVSSRVVETPVEEAVSLREEHVHVERKTVDRPAEARDLENFKGTTVELVETDEEAVVAKKARVIEEVVVSKDVTQRTDTIHETLRHTEIDVQSIAPTGQRTTIPQFEQYDVDFRQDFEAGNYQKLGYNYEHITPAYRYGYHLGTSDSYKGREWSTIEPEARQAWEERNPGTWEQVKEAARHAWDKVTGRR